MVAVGCLFVCVSFRFGVGCLLIPVARAVGIVGWLLGLLGVDAVICFALLLVW